MGIRVAATIGRDRFAAEGEALMSTPAVHRTSIPPDRWPELGAAHTQNRLRALAGEWDVSCETTRKVVRTEY